MKALRLASTVAAMAFALLLPACKDNNQTSSTGSPAPSSTALPKATLPGPGTTSTKDAAVPTAQEVKGEVALTRNFYFVFDGSGSMNERPPVSCKDNLPRGEPDTKITCAKWAVREFLKTVPDDVNLGLYVFDTYGSREVLALGSNNREKFLYEVNRIQAGGGTPLGASIKSGVESLTLQFKKQLGYGDYRLIVITDGESTDSLVPGVRAAQTSGMPIYTIGFGIGKEHSLRKDSVTYMSADSAREVKTALEAAAAELDVYDPADFKQKK